MMNDVTGVEDIQTSNAMVEVLDSVPTEIDPMANMDPRQMIREIGKFNPKWANNLWYKLCNKAGDIKTLGDTSYIVSPRGNWVKQLPAN